MNHFVGIDVSKNKLDCLWLRDPESMKVKTKSIENSLKGFSQLVAWLLKNTDDVAHNIHVIMEATGVYHEALANCLYEQGFQVSVANPARVRYFAKGHGILQKTDKKDSLNLALFGYQNRPELWEPEPLEVRKLKAMLTRLEALEKDLQRENNRLEKAEITRTSEVVLESLHKMIAQLKAEKIRVEKQIDSHINNHPQLKKDRKLMESIAAVGPVVSRWMLSVLHGRKFDKASQVAAYLGLIPVLWESGTLKGRSHLSKQGPGVIRAKLYMAAVVGIKHNPDIQAQYKRLLSNGKTKMQAIGAAMRKLVQICFGVVKHQSEYQPRVA